VGDDARILAAESPTVPTVPTVDVPERPPADLHQTAALVAQRQGGYTDDQEVKADEEVEAKTSENGLLGALSREGSVGDVGKLELTV